MNNDERIFSIVELIKNAISHWKVVAFAIFIGMVGLAGFKYWSSYSDWKNASLQIIDEEQNGMSVADIDYVNRVVKNYKSIVESQENYTRSYLVKMDYSNVYKVRLDYYIGGVDYNDATQVVMEDISKSYQHFVSSPELYMEVSSVIPSITYSEVKYLIVPEMVGNNITIDIKAATQEDANILRDYVKIKLDEYSLELQELIIPHKLMARKEYMSTEMDSDISFAQTDYLADILKQKNRIREYILHMNYNQVALFEKNSGESIAEKFGVTYQDLGFKAPVLSMEEGKPSISKKAILLGAFLGMIIALMGISGVYLFGLHVVSPVDVSDNWNIAILGTTTHQNGKKHTNLVYRNSIKKTVETFDYALSLISQTVSGNETVAFTSSIYTSEDLIALLSHTKWCEVGLKIEYIGKDKLNTESAIDEFAKTEYRILVERYGCTTKQNLKKELELCKLFEKKVLGSIWFI